MIRTSLMREMLFGEDAGGVELASGGGGFVRPTRVNNASHRNGSDGASLSQLCGSGGGLCCSLAFVWLLTFVPTLAAQESSQFQAERAFGYLKSVCEIGPRISGQPGMFKQQEALKKHFEDLDAKVAFQRFNVKDPLGNGRVNLANLIVRWHPDREKRILLCCHYDTRPFPDSDRTNPRGRFIGANDGGSGVALLAELGHHVGTLEGDYGVDFVFFDGEEFVYDRRRDAMFLGSTWFAQQYADNKFDVRYEFGILVDMIGDKDLQIYYEGNSLGYARRLTRSIWGVAKDLGVREFVPKKRHQIKDDHLPLNSIAKIETCDIIDFDFPNPQLGNVYWHTQQDVIENCSADSLEKVGRVVLEWLRRLQQGGGAK